MQEPLIPQPLLLVDDDVTFCEVLGSALSKRGFTVTTATGIDQALMTADKLDPEYAVVDLRIGQESGLNLVAELKARHEHLRIVILTGYASIATAVEAIKLGANHYLTKPADVDEIVRALNREETGDPDIEPANAPVSVKRLEWEHLQKVLLDHDGNISAAARALGMHRRTLQRKLAKHPVKK